MCPSPTKPIRRFSAALIDFLPTLVHCVLSSLARVDAASSGSPSSRSPSAAKKPSTCSAVTVLEGRRRPLRGCGPCPPPARGCPRPGRGTSGRPTTPGTPAFSTASRLVCPRARRSDRSVTLAAVGDFAMHLLGRGGGLRRSRWAAAARRSPQRRRRVGGVDPLALCRQADAGAGSANSAQRASTTAPPARAAAKAAAGRTGTKWSASPQQGRRPRRARRAGQRRRGCRARPGARDSR